ncbi:MAG: hypothetical protein KGR98_05175, partial [Verrucomicrobia bacterium]|nr:hypothetical protein [Verrucomicrobiota bacterium]
YGPLDYLGHAVSMPFTFTATGTNGAQIAATFNLYDGTNHIGMAEFGYILGVTTTVWSNTGSILIDTGGNAPAVAAPYPSIINVSGLNGVIVKSTVTLTNMNFSSPPKDVEALLVAPNQPDTLLMSHAGGYSNIANVTITFDDAAANSLPRTNVITSGVYRPTTNAPPSPVFP